MTSGGAPRSNALTVIVPCFNEEQAIEPTLRQLREHLARFDPAEIIVVDDGSTDSSAEIVARMLPEFEGLRLVRHERNRGYGAALKTGIRRARTDLVAITDADGTYPNDRIADLATAGVEADMVVGSRTGAKVEYSRLRAFPKFFMRSYCAWVTRQSIPDLNSGLRVLRRSVAERFLHLLPDSFSFTTTITIAMLTNNYVVRYVPIDYARRVGVSKISPIRDTLRFGQLILRTALYFAPLRVLSPLIVALWLAFAGALVYDVVVAENLADKTVLLLMFATNVTILALLADMLDKRLS